MEERPPAQSFLHLLDPNSAICRSPRLSEGASVSAIAALSLLVRNACKLRCKPVPAIGLCRCRSAMQRPAYRPCTWCAALECQRRHPERRTRVRITACASALPSCLAARRHMVRCHALASAPDKCHGCAIRACVCCLQRSLSHQPADRLVKLRDVVGAVPSPRVACCARASSGAMSLPQWSLHDATLQAQTPAQACAHARLPLVRCHAFALRICSADMSASGSRSGM